VEQHTQFSDSLSEMEFENKRQRQLESLRSILS
jgi:hypothetical protein